MEIASVRGNKKNSEEFFKIFKFDKINSAKFTNAGILCNCQNEHFNIHVPIPEYIILRLISLMY
jgi:hypothetical protein